MRIETKGQRDRGTKGQREREREQRAERQRDQRDRKTRETRETRETGRLRKQRNVLRLGALSVHVGGPGYGHLGNSWLIAWLADCLPGRLLAWLVGCLDGRLPGWPAVWVASWMVGSSDGCLAACLGLVSWRCPQSRFPGQYSRVGQGRKGSKRVWADWSQMNDTLGVMDVT